MKYFISFLLAFFITFNPIVYACTDFRLTAKDGSILITRSMEFALDLKSNLRSSPQGRQFTTAIPDGKPGLSWQSKYGYLYVDGLNVDIAIDGMNEQGLSIEALYLPGETEYQTIPTGQNQRALGYDQLGHWLLGNFKNVDEVRQALNNIFVYAAKIPGMQDVIFPLHFAVHDAGGNGIVVEFVKGKMNIFDNKLGVMTNSPTYDWHLTNLRNYLNLSPYNPKPVVTNGITFASTGQGGGMVGLPGDISPPSRFVKIALMKETVLPTENALSTLNLAQHLINNVDIPLGFVREAKTNNATNELTQWVVFKDLTHKIFYYRTYDNLTLRAVSFNKIDFSTKAPLLKMPLTHADADTVQNVTSTFLTTK